MSDTQLHKILTNPKLGQRLGTSSATWNKIKSATMDPRKGPEEKDASEEKQSPTLVAQGPNGEICLWYDASSTYEMWGWETPGGYTHYHESNQSINSFWAYHNRESPGENYSGDTLSLLTKFVASGRSVLAMVFMPTDRGTLFVSACRENDSFFLETRQGWSVDIFKLAPMGECLDSVGLKASSNFLVMSSGAGLLSVMKYDSRKRRLVHANDDGSLANVVNHFTRPILEQGNDHGSIDNRVVLKTAVFENSPVYDIMGTWLVYCPTKSEMTYFKNLHLSGNNVSTKAKDMSQARKSLFTTVRLPPSGPLLLRVVSSLSNSAIDKIYKLSQFGSNKLKNYLNTSSKPVEKDLSLQSISSSIGKALNSTASMIQKQAGMIGENEYIKVIDLSNGHIVATFKPPGGISHLSLSGYDLQLAQATLRGDNIYLWDLYQLPKEVFLAGKFVRGKTSAIIGEIFWFMNSKSVDGAQVTNSGFGCITKKTGSVHWYNINYLSRNGNDNRPNVSKEGAQHQVGSFLDSWILPSVGAKRFFKVPGYANVPSDMANTGKCAHAELCKLTQLAFLDSKLNLRLVSPLNGKHIFKYKLKPKSTAIGITNSTRAHIWNPITAKNKADPPQVFKTPLSQSEIQTCSPYSSLVKEKGVVVSAYDIEQNGFWKYFETFGNDVPVATHDFSRITDPGTPHSSSEDLLVKLDQNLIFDQEPEAD